MISFTNIYCKCFINFPFSPAPSDLLKIGFFKTDRATQTEVSDILELKELSTAIETLGKVRE